MPGVGDVTSHVNCHCSPGVSNTADAGGTGIPTNEDCTCLGDTNGDFVVDIDDVVAVVLAFGGNDPDADVNDDGFVDIDDIVAVVLRRQRARVPEPSRRFHRMASSATRGHPRL